MYTKYNYTSHDTILYQLPPDNNNQIFNCGNENYTEIIIEHVDLEQNSKDVGLHIINRTDWAIHFISTATWNKNSQTA